MFRSKLTYIDFWKRLNEAAKRYATDPGGPDYRAAVDEMLSSVPKLSDADIILIIEELNDRRNMPWATRLKAGLLSEQSRRDSGRHRTIVLIGAATLIATLVTLVVTYASLQ